MADDKNEAHKTPRPQNPGPPERPKMPENRIVHGENKSQNPINARLKKP